MKLSRRPHMSFASAVSVGRETIARKSCAVGATACMASNVQLIRRGSYGAEFVARPFVSTVERRN